jgi:hypothetical protein
MYHTKEIMGTVVMSAVDVARPVGDGCVDLL